MKAGILSVVLATLVSGQVPLPAPPDLLLPPNPTPEMGGMALPGPKVMGGVPLPDARELISPSMPKDFSKPASLVPVYPDARVPEMLQTGQKTAVPMIGGEGVKPPPFKLIDNAPPPSEGPQLREVPSLVAEPLAPTGAVATSSLMLTRTGPANVKAGQPFYYELVVRNVGSAVATMARLEEELPPGTRLVSAQPMPVGQSDRLTWTVDNLAPGSERRFRVEVECSRDGEWRASATLSVTVTNAMRATVIGAAQQAVVMTGPNNVPVGHPVTLQMRVTNTTGATLPDAILRVLLAPGLQHLHGDAIEAPLGDLAPGQTRELTLEAVTLQTGRLTADATLLSRQKSIAAGRVAITATDQPILILRQTGPLAPPVGGEYDYKLEVTNRSTAEVRETLMTNELPEGMQFVRGDNGAQFDPATRLIHWNLGTLLPGQAKQVIFRAQARGPGPQMNRAGVRAAGVAEAQLYTILRVSGAK